MDSSLVRKIEKAKDYALQPERVKMKAYSADFEGDNGNHTVKYEAGNLNCTCNYFRGHGTCSHTMAMQIMLKEMTTAEAMAAD